MSPKFIMIYISLLFSACSFVGAKEQNELYWNKALKESVDRKQTFISLLLPLIDEQNQKIVDNREFIKNFFEKYPNNDVGVKIAALDYTKLLSLASTYKIEDVFNKKEYFEKIDTIPASLILSQAALESGWGSSRISLNSNNLFGQKAFGAKKYLKSNDSSNVKYAAFDTIGEAVCSYMTNLNSHGAYKEFRKKRADTRVKNTGFTGLKAAKTLKHYSETDNYTAMLSKMIKSYFGGYDEVTNIIVSTANRAMYMRQESFN